MIAGLGLALFVIGAVRLHTAEGVVASLTGFYAVVLGAIAATLGLWLG